MKVAGKMGISQIFMRDSKRYTSSISTALSFANIMVSTRQILKLAAKILSGLRKLTLGGISSMSFNLHSFLFSCEVPKCPGFVCLF